MCLSKAYRVSEGEQELICEYVGDIRIDGTTIYLTDIVGQESVIEGTVMRVDLINNAVYIKAA